MNKEMIEKFLQEMQTTEGKRDFKPARPDFKSDGCAVWKSTTKEGKEMLRIKLAGHNTICVFKNDEVKQDFSDLNRK